VNRDWQDDKTSNLLKRCEIAKSYNETISVWPDAIIELINKATAEKARADIAELAYKGLTENAVSRGEYDSLLKKHTAMTKEYWEQKERADQAEAREQMLREAIEEAISRSWGGEMSSLLDIKNALKASLYPKEATE